MFSRKSGLFIFLLGACQTWRWSVTTLFPPRATVSMATVAQLLIKACMATANRWLRDVKTYRLPWYLTLVSTNHASSNPSQICVFGSIVLSQFIELKEPEINQWMQSRDLYS